MGVRSGQVRSGRAVNQDAKGCELSLSGKHCEKLCVIGPDIINFTLV